MMFVLIGLIAFLVIAGGFFLRPSRSRSPFSSGSHSSLFLFGSVNGAVVSATVAVSIMMAQPLFSLLGMVTVLCMLYLSDIPPDDFGIFPEKIFELTDKAVLLAIPFFVVSGAIMTKGGIAKRLISLGDRFDGLDPRWSGNCGDWWLRSLCGNQWFFACNRHCDWRHDVSSAGESRF